MPLFETIENDVATFFVSQGSVFDALVRSFMERMARVESRVDALARDVAANYASVSHLVQSISTTMDAHNAGTLVRFEQIERSVPASTATGTAGVESDASNGHATNERTHIDNTNSAADHMNTHELEYYAMTLARQLHFVLELFFQPHAHDMVHTVQSKQTQFESISDALTHNEAILMQLATRDAKTLHADNHDKSDTHQHDGIMYVESSNERASDGVTTPEQALNDDVHNDTHHTAAHDSLALPDRINVVRTEMDADLPLQPSTDLEPVEAAKTASTGINSSPSSNIYINSLYDSLCVVHDQQLRDTDNRRHQQAQQAMLANVQQLLATAKRQWRDEAAASMMLEWQTNARALESQQLKLQSEWKCYQEHHQQQQQSASDASVGVSSDVDRQLTALSDALLSSQQTHEQQTAMLVERLQAFEHTCIDRSELDALVTTRLQSARDACVHGVNADALAAFKLEMEVFATQLASHVASQQPSQQDNASTLLAMLLDEVNRVLALLSRVLALLEPNGDGLHDAAGMELMQTLRLCLTAIDDVVQRVERDELMSSAGATAVAETLRQMELGTASLLDVVETQHEQYERAFATQQHAIADLQRELLDQRQADDALKRQLAACPSHEDTMRFIHELRDQIHASASDSTSHMLETVDDLRLRMGGLPSADVVERLTLAMQHKADRVEMDRLEKLLAAAANNNNNNNNNINSNSAGPVGSLTKSPLKCLSCDQHLLYAHTSSGSGNSPERFHQHHHTCSQATKFEPASSQPPSPNRDIFDLSTGASRRRKQRQRYLLGATTGTGGSSSSNATDPLSQNNWLESASRAFVNLDDSRNRTNRIPLRRTVLSDQIVYGPAITPQAFRRRQPGAPLNRFDPEQPRMATARPKTAMSPDRRASGGEIITRTVSSTVIIRPFAEQLKRTGSDRRTPKH